MSLAAPASRPLKVVRREIRTLDTNAVVSGVNFFGSNTKGGAEGLAEFNRNEMLAFYTWIRSLYVANQTVTLTYVASGGNLGTMRDRRFQAGTMVSRAGDGSPGDAGAGEFIGAGSTPNISAVNTLWSKINVNYDTSVAMPNHLDYGALSRPLTMGSYSANRKNIKEYSADVFGELVAEALAEIGGNKAHSSYTDMTTGREGGYAILRQDATIPTTHDDGGGLTDMGRVFEDTVANASAYTAAGLGPASNTTGEVQDQPLALDNANRWNLYSMDANSVAPPEPPNMVYVDPSTGHIHEWGMANMTAFFQPYVQHIAANGYNSQGKGKLHFYISGEIAGVNSGTGGSIYPLDGGFGEMINEELNGSSASGYTTLQVGDDYRSQEFPNGTAQAVNTYSLRSYTEV